MSAWRSATLSALLLVTSSFAAEPPRLDAFGDPLPDGATRRLGTARWRLPGYTRSAVLSPDGNTIIAESNGAFVRLDAQTGKMVEVPGGRVGGSSEALLVSRDGRTLVMCRYNSITVWDLATDKAIGTFNTNNRSGPESYALADSGGFLATASRFPSREDTAGRVTVYDLAATKIVATIESMHNQSIQTTFAPDGKTLATFGQHYNRNAANAPPAESPNTIVQIWDVATSKEKLRVSTGGYVSTVRFSPDGRSLITAGTNAPIQLWDTATAKLIRHFPARSGQGVRLFFSPDGKQLASTGSDGGRRRPAGASASARAFARWYRTSHSRRPARPSRSGCGAMW